MSDEPRQPDTERPTLDPETLDPSFEPAEVVLERPEAPPVVADDGRLRTGKLAGLAMGAAIWVLGWPVLVESFLNSFVGLTDTYLAAGLGGPETDAVGGASYIMWFIGLVVMALGVGATAVISRCVGKGRLAAASATLGQTLLLAVVAGVAIGVVVSFAIDPVASILSMTPEAHEAFRDYLLVICVGAPFMSLMFCGIACARGAGDSLSPLIAMIVRNVVNVGISFALAGVDIKRGGHTILASPFDLGVVGIAIGTVASDLVGASIIVAMAVGGRWSIRLKPRWLRPRRVTAWRVIRVGVPNFLETAGMWLGNFLTMLMVGGIGAGVGGTLGAHIIAIRIEAFSFLPGFAMGTAAATLAGQYLGAGRPDLARRAVVRCALIAALVMGTLGAAFVAYPREIVGLLSDQPEHLAVAPHLVRICGFVQFPFGLAIVTRAALRGAGDVRVVMMLTWMSTWLVRVPAAFILSGADITFTTTAPDGVQTLHTLLANPFGFAPSLPMLWVALCGELVLRSVIFGARFAQGAWTRVKV